MSDYSKNNEELDTSATAVKPEPASDVPMVLDMSEFERSIKHESHWLDVDKPAVLAALSSSDPRFDDLRKTGISARTFAWGTLVIAALVILAVSAFNYKVDPLGNTTADSRPKEMNVKLAQIDELKTPVDTLILGSSVVMKYEPAAAAEIFGGRAYNAGVSSAKPSVMFSLASYFEERFKRAPNMVIGLNAWALSQRAGNDGYLVNEPRLYRQINPQSTWDRLKELSTYASFDLAKASVTKLRGPAGGGSDGADGAANADADAPVSKNFIGKNGAYLSEYSTKEKVIRRRMNKTARGYRVMLNRWEEGGRPFDTEQVDYFERLLALANKYDHVPAVVLVPFNPITTQELHDTLFAEKQKALLDLLHDIQTRHDFKIIDMRDAKKTGIDERYFYDSSHISPVAGRMVLEEVAKQHPGMRVK